MTRASEGIHSSSWRQRRRYGMRRLFFSLSLTLWFAGLVAWSPIDVARAEDDDDAMPKVSSSSFLKNDPFFIVSTVDGSIGVLRALDGSFVGGFRSGAPLVGPSELLSGGRRIVPGLDGRLYVSLEHQEGLLQPLEITVVDVLQTPVKTCSGGGSSCGIVTATKSTSLFALDAKTGRLVWKQSPNGTTIVEDETDSVVTSTVLLQREDVLVQQLSTDSGRSVWNVTLGTVQALEFGEGSGGSDGSSLPSHQPGGAYLPSGSAADSRQVLMQDYFQPVALPSVIFGPDGTSLMAVSSDGNDGVHVLWKRDFPTVVASVFGLQDKTWKPLTVLEDQDPTGSSAASDGETKPQLGAETSQHSPSLVTVYRPPVLQQLFHYWSNPMSLLDRLADDWFFATGQHNRRPRTSGSSRFWPTLESSQVVVPKKHTLAPLLQYHDLFAQPRHYHSPKLALPSSPFNTVDDFSNSWNYADGVFMTWPFLVCFCIVVVGVAALIFRYLYLQKKTQWMQLVQQMANVGLLGGNLGGNGDAATGETTSDLLGVVPSPTLRRSHSLPDVAAAPIEQVAPIKRRLRSESLQISYTVDGRMFSDKELADSPGGHPSRIAEENGATSTTAANTSMGNTLQEQQQQPQPQGVGFLVDGIPLIRYNRYDSEFTEVVALGKGGFGTVFRCKNVLDGREYAIKKVSLKYKEGLPLEEFRQRLQRTLREVKSLALLDHPNIVRYYNAWLELRQTGQDEGTTPGKGAADSHAPADSDYYLFSPTTSPGMPRGRISGSDTTSCQLKQRRRPSLNNGHYLKNGYNNAANPLGAWNGFDDDETENEPSFQPFVSGVPAALDDYGFTFDRSDEEGDEAGDATAVAPANESINTKGAPKRLSSTDEKSKSLGFFPHGPTIHRYSSNYSEEAESSIEGSTMHSEGWSRESRNQTDRRVSITNTSTDERETQAAAALSAGNPSTPPAIMVRHILYIQMQFCSQKTLADFLSNPEARKTSETTGQVDIPYALSLFLQIAQGVQHVHSQGLIHRDLKPNNCFMDDSGAVKVGDFGLSRESANENRECLEPLDELGKEADFTGKEAASIREITAGVGTRSYASPEQMKGSDYDSSTDIYSLGIMLFELCYPMYTGMERTIVLSKLRNHIFPDHWMQAVQPAFPTLHSLLESMLSNSPADRPTALIVVRSIQSILEGFTIFSIDKHHHDNAILLRVETKPREDVLRHTMDLVTKAAEPDIIEIIQYGLRGGTNKAVMEFAISSSTCEDQASLGNTLVTRLGKEDEVLLIRQVSGTKYSHSH